MPMPTKKPENCDPMWWHEQKLLREKTMQRLFREIKDLEDTRIKKILDDAGTKHD